MVIAGNHTYERLSVIWARKSGTHVDPNLRPTKDGDDPLCGCVIHEFGLRLGLTRPPGARSPDSRTSLTDRLGRPLSRQLPASLHVRQPFSPQTRIRRRLRLRQRELRTPSRERSRLALHTMVRIRSTRRHRHRSILPRLCSPNEPGNDLYDRRTHNARRLHSQLSRNSSQQPSTAYSHHSHPRPTHHRSHSLSTLNQTGQLHSLLPKRTRPDRRERCTHLLVIPGLRERLERC